MINEIETANFIIDYDKNQFYTDIKYINSLDIKRAYHIVTVNSLLNSNDYIVDSIDLTLPYRHLIAECYALGYALKELINNDLDGTIFVTPELYGYYHAATIQEHYEELKPFLDRCYLAMYHYCKTRTFETALGNVMLFKTRRIKIRITPTETMRHIENLTYQKGFRFKDTGEPKKKLHYLKEKENV